MIRLFRPIMGEGIIESVEDTLPIIWGDQGGRDVEASFNPGIFNLVLPDYHGAFLTDASTSGFYGGYLEGPVKKGVVTVFGNGSFKGRDGVTVGS